MPTFRVGFDKMLLYRRMNAWKNMFVYI